MPNTIRLRRGTGAPSAASFQVGEPAWDQANGVLYVKNAAGTMVPIGSSGGAYTFSATPPASPAVGDEWTDSDDGITYQWVNDGTSSAWVELGTVGLTGAQGAAGSVTVGTTTTGAAGTSASVTNSGTSSAAILNFTIPRGDTGLTGTAATVAVGTTTTGAAGSSASVTNSGTSSAATFNFTIPRGDTGATGATGPMGPKSLAILSPTASEDIILFFTTSSQTLTQIRSTVMGTTPSITFSIRYGTDHSLAGTEVVTGGIVCNSTTTGISTTTFNNATIPANNFVWLTTSASSGTVTQLAVSLIF